MHFLFWRALFRRIRAIPSYFKDRTVAWWKKAILGGGILYMLSPVDLIPEPVLLLGVLDDLAIIGFILYYLRDELDRYWLGEKPIDPAKRFRGKKIIEDVDYTVEDEAGQAGKKN
ncbi:MAG TPA: DUF1232 domain-containing protein [Clostridiales bacterium]|jgi:uncharacterized membrane protein YkvA (DUF1232 family)|nr:DUF1232 domain-containing protein [Clostridiales bacterium]